MNEKKTYRYKYILEIEAPLMFKTGVPAHIQLDFLAKSLPYMLIQALGGEANVSVVEVNEKS